jgi:hypothetical protein
MIFLEWVQPPGSTAHPGVVLLMGLARGGGCLPCGLFVVADPQAPRSRRANARARRWQAAGDSAHPVDRRIPQSAPRPLSTPAEDRSAMQVVSWWDHSGFHNAIPTQSTWAPYAFGLTDRIAPVTVRGLALLATLRYRVAFALAGCQGRRCARSLRVGELPNLGLCKDTGRWCATPRRRLLRPNNWNRHPSSSPTWGGNSGC